MAERFGGVNVPKEMWKPSITEELKQQSKKWWLTNVTGKISSMMANSKPDTTMHRDQTGGIPGISQSAELGDDEIRPAIEMTKVLERPNPMPEAETETKTKAEVKRLHPRKNSHTARPSPAREKAPMQVHRKAAAGQFARATKAKTASLNRRPPTGTTSTKGSLKATR